jgi:hypothetical protein
VSLNQFRQPEKPGGPVQQPYSYSVPSPHRMFKNSSIVFKIIWLDWPKHSGAEKNIWPLRKTFFFFFSKMEPIVFTIFLLKPCEKSSFSMHSWAKSKDNKTA